MSVNFEQESVKMICQMFSEVDEDGALKLLQKNNGNLEKTIDELLNITLQREPITNNAEELQLNEGGVQATEETLEEKQQILEDFTVIQSDAQEEPTQAETLPKSLEQQLAEALEAKERVEEEKKKAMKWCLEEMNALREQIKQKDETIAQQQKDIVALRERVQNTKTKKVEKYFTDTKAAFVEGFHSLSEQINTNISKVQKEIKDESVIFEKLKAFVAEIKQEIMELFKPTKKAVPAVTNSTSTTTTTTVPISVNEREAIQNLKEKDPELYEATRASLTSVVEDMESDLQFADELNKAKKASLGDNNGDVAVPTNPPVVFSQPPVVSSPVVTPPATPIPTPNIPMTQPFPPQQPYYVYPQQPYYPPPQNFSGYPYYPPQYRRQ